MMEWKDEEQNSKKGMSLSSKILLGIIACIMLIIILLIILLMNVQKMSFKIYIDGKEVTLTKTELLTTIDNETYVNIKKFAELVGYEYHNGEYKSSIIEEDKCYVEGKEETASFYLNNNIIYKLPVNNRNEPYKEIEIDDTIKNINKDMYASLDAISKAFNVVLEETKNDFQAYTLEKLITIYDANVKKMGYTGISSQSLESQKSLLYGYLIVRKEGGLYKIIDANTSKEIVLDRYNSIEFSENMQEFIVTDSSNKVGIINLDGSTKIEPIYEEISVLDKKLDLYLVKLSSKYGVISGNNKTIIFPEYDSIGLNSNTTNNTSNNRKLILDTLIPVSKSGKWGAYNKEGKLVINLEYDDFGFELTSIEVDGIKEHVQPILTIKRANGVVVKKSNKYGLISLNGEELVPVEVDGIYEVRGIEDENLKYHMLYNGEEINLIERLIKAGKIDKTTTGAVNNTITNTTQNIENNIVTNEV